MRISASRTAKATGVGAALAVLTISMNAAAASSQPRQQSAPISAVAQANAVLAKMTFAEKLDLVSRGVVSDPSLGIPPIKFIDGPNGIGEGATGATAFANAEVLAATFNTSLAYEYGTALGAEAAGKGYTTLAAPTINIVRSPLWGREAESFGEDPYLTSQLVAPEIRGIQSQHVMAVVKHFAAYNQETGRFGISLNQPADNVVVSLRALAEIYYPGFAFAVRQGGAASVMCSYNQINGVPSCQDASTLGRLRKFGFKGFVEPDEFWAIRDVLAAAKAGVNNFVLGSMIDAIPSESGGAAEEAALQQYVNNGKLAQKVITDSARDILVGMAEVGLLGRAAPMPHSIVSTAAHRGLNVLVATEGTVLLQNSHRVLPLATSGKSIAVIGYDAGNGTQDEEGGSAVVIPYGGPTTPLQGIESLVGSSDHVTYAQGTPGVVPLTLVPSSSLKPSSGSGSGLYGTFYGNTTLTGTPLLREVNQSVDFGWPPPWLSTTGIRNYSVRWTGTILPPMTGTYLFSLTLAGSAKLLIGGKVVDQGNAEWTQLTPAQGANQVTFQGRVRLVAGVPTPIEIDYSTAAATVNPSLALGWQPPNSLLINQAVSVARSASDAVIFVNDVAGEGMDRPSLALPGDQNQLIAAVAAANPNTIVVLHTSGPVLMPWRSKVAGIIEAWYPGQGSGTAIAQTLFGKADPSGRLPVTFPASSSQGPTSALRAFPGVNNVVRYGEGIFVGYRYYQHSHQVPSYPFGYGLSYTSFALGSPTVTSLGRDAFSVSLDVKNVGAYSGADVVEMYVADPSSVGEPPRQLKGFARIDLAPGQDKTVKMKLGPLSFAYYNSKLGTWVDAPGRYRVYLGSSSASLPLSFVVNVSGGRA